MMNVMGIIFSNMHQESATDLLPNRCMGSIPVGGRYRLVDFMLSSFANSGIENVGIITKTNYQSLMNHVGTGREWDLARKKGGLVVLPPFGHHAAGIYQNRIEALHGTMNYIKTTPGDYVITSDCDVMMNADFHGMYDFHRQINADLTVLYHVAPLPDLIPRDLCAFNLEPDGRVRDVLIEPEQSESRMRNIYLPVTLISKKLLEHIISSCHSRNRFNFERDILQEGARDFKLYAYEYTGFAARFSSLNTYFANNMLLLNPDVRAKLFPRSLPVFTKVRDEAPVRYGLNSSVRNCLMADGCVIEGEVENSVIFRGVTVGKGAKIKNSVVMQGTAIGRGASLDCVITDKNVVIQEGRTLAGFNTYPVYIAKGAVV